MSLTKIKVRYAETDAMAIVHHANYYIYFEVAREDLIKEFGISYREIEESGLMMPLVETQCRYMDAAKYDDDLIVEASIDEITSIKVKIKYIVRREVDNKILAKGSTLQTFVDSKTFKIISLEKTNIDVWNKFTGK
ncbi:acyl-CoA thioesterase [Clostridium gasigenes]|uniref:Acyl-CoA thioester hydrolase n=1 Tax=Clostridium gasigenes TaxID=94869 RepID=A0A1H0T3T5_9CLOT|nr:thioesterase family protein [Clostridium gasigenes]MBB6623780.1 acyl-CoA thioesterase [Clostridium gasigenes]MBU3088912.1 acyl-CoA thioesterase [Clostridium gasigenes]MBU3134337.1 acyl-CoA thioesterase [Clostridium gasigenes]SDP48475.1 acyl-CoA thioester hydrolase [Clostridium gasigenes]